MSGNGSFASSSMNGAWSSGGASARRPSKLGGVGSNSKRRRTRRTLLQSTKRRVLKISVLCALLLVLGLAVYDGDLFFSPSKPRGDKASNSVAVQRKLPGGGANDSDAIWVAEARTDMTTKGLYDEIEFKDEEGGVWRQGWNVQYKGHEWDKEKLKVIVIPHSHNDPGWIRTVEEYYQERTKSILSTIVAALKKDKRRKFIWEEMSFLERWWQDASASEKEDFKYLARSGQLEIVGGGWVMNDEANAHYYGIIQQMIAGNLWLQDTIGVTPRNSWAIDPFGHSPTMAYLLRRMGFKNMLIQRTHYEVKKYLAKTQNLEFMWRQSWDGSNSTDIFCHMMPFYSYDIPHTCGPEPSICCQFDYWRLPGVYGAQMCPWHKNPQEINAQNVRERSELLLDQYRKKSTMYRSNTLLIPLGDDFRFITMQEAELQFTNLQKIFDYINSQPYLKATVKFGTLEDYFTTLREEAGRLSPSRTTSDTVPGFPSLSGDFFTYSDKEQDYWSGYYVSRPFYKAVDRVLEESLRSADILFTLTASYCRAEKSDFPLSYASKFVSARRNLALFQHHDGITGTAKYHVVQDYGERMHSALHDLMDFMAKSVSTLLSHRNSGGKCPGANEKSQFYVPEETRAKYDVLPVKTLVGVSGDQVRRVVLFNSLAEVSSQIVTILVNDPHVCVFDSEWKSVPSQVSPDWNYGSVKRPDTGKHRLQWEAKVPGLGLQTYIVASSATAESCIGATRANLFVRNTRDDFVCPADYQCAPVREDHVKIANSHHTLIFNGKNGLLQSLYINDGGDTVAVEEELAFYSSRASGAYLFAPDGEARSFVEPGGLIMVTKGYWMEEVYTVPKCEWETSPVVRIARLYAGKSVQAGVAEMEYRTYMDSQTFNEKELITRFKTELNNKGVFYSDLNGFQTIRREKYDKIPLQANYYPMPALAFIQCPTGRRFSINSRQALGVASLDKGWLEVMLDRRLIHDDGRGLGHGVLDNRQNAIVFHLLFEHATDKPVALDQSSASRAPSLLSHRVGAQLNHPLHAFIGEREERAEIEAASTLTEFHHGLQLAPFKSDLPCDLHLVSMQVPSLAGIKPSSKQSVGLLLHRRGLDPSFGFAKYIEGSEQCSLFQDEPVKLDELFQDLTVSNPMTTTLNLLHDQVTEFNQGGLQQVHRKQGGSIKLESTSPMDVYLDPMEIKGYKFQLQ